MCMDVWEGCEGGRSLHPMLSTAMEQALNHPVDKMTRPVTTSQPRSA